MLSPFALHSRAALSEAKGLRVNSAKDLLCSLLGKYSRCFAEFTLSGEKQIPRFARNDSEGIRMTWREWFPAAPKAGVS